MGLCLSSVVFKPDPDRPGHDDIALEVYKMLSLTQGDLNSLYSTFTDIDKQGSGHVHPHELYFYLRMEPNELIKQMFKLFDVNKLGKLNFLEFVCAMWNFLSMDPGLLGNFAFTVFDKDKSGALDFAEIRRMIEIIHGKSYASNSGIRTMIDDIKEIDTYVTIEQFAKYSKNTPTACAPLISLQFMMRKRIIGDTFWNRLARRRLEVKEQQDPLFCAKICQFTYEKNENLKKERLLAEKEKERKNQLEVLASRNGNKQTLSLKRTSLMLNYFRVLNPYAKREDSVPVKKKKPRIPYLGHEIFSRIHVMPEEELEDNDSESEVLTPKSKTSLTSENEKPRRSRKTIVQADSASGSGSAPSSRPGSARKSIAKSHSVSDGSEKPRRSRKTIVKKEEGLVDSHLPSGSHAEVVNAASTLPPLKPRKLEPL